MEKTEASTSRRAVLAGAGAAGIVVALAGCAAYGDTGSGSNPPAPNDNAAQPSAAGNIPPAAGQSGNAGNPNAGGKVLAKLSDIPVGGGKILGDIVVVQPAAGTVKAFSAICTHAGCTVAEIKGGTINCPCHGSKFKVADGSVSNGPAAKPLPPVKVTVDGDNIRQA